VVWNIYLVGVVSGYSVSELLGGGRGEIYAWRWVDEYLPIQPLYNEWV
jgi:hypothetical protein